MWLERYVVEMVADWKGMWLERYVVGKVFDAEDIFRDANTVWACCTYVHICMVVVSV
jgi:hypothetical protein